MVIDVDLLLILQNALGFVLVGALAGYVYLQKTEKAESVDNLSGKLSDEQQAVNSLKDQVQCRLLAAWFLYRPDY